jgi:predicted PolB exonuclease-like 3'-5' exonuclease
MKTLKILALTAIISTLSMAQKEALLIGVGDYQGKKNDLKGIEIDVSNMKSLFEKWGFHTTVLLDSDSMKIDEYLTKYHSLGANDIFAFYLCS